MNRRRQNNIPFFLSFSLSLAPSSHEERHPYHANSNNRPTARSTSCFSFHALDYQQRQSGPERERERGTPRLSREGLDYPLSFFIKTALIYFPERSNRRDSFFSDQSIDEERRRRRRCCTRAERERVNWRRVNEDSLGSLTTGRSVSE